MCIYVGIYIPEEIIHTQYKKLTLSWSSPTMKTESRKNVQDPGEAEHSWDTELAGRRLEEGLLPAREWYYQKIGKEVVGLSGKEYEDRMFSLLRS